VLAQRSAVAAKEIRQLIAQSSDQISEATLQMGSADKTIGGGATHEQATGIAQVNEAVTQLDTATQQNAARVEQSAASAAGLKHGADSMSRSVAVFQI